MFEDALSLGGVVRRSVDLETGEVLPLPDVEAEKALSTGHNSPQITLFSGASLLKVKRTAKEQGKQKQEGAKRGKVSEFSKRSRKRLINTLAQVRRDRLPCFVTLTYPAVYSGDPKVWKRHLDNFIKRLARKFPNVAGVWKLEPQKRGAPHFHLMIWGAPYVDLLQFVPMAWYEVVGSNDGNHLLWHMGALGNGNKHCVQQVEKVRGVFWYASKYMSKEVSGWGDVGRWWGVFFRERLPLGQVVNVEVSEEKAIEFIRYMRRFARVRSRDYRSLTIVCNPDLWLNKLL
jgi:hypothetical protein